MAPQHAAGCPRDTQPSKCRLTVVIPAVAFIRIEMLTSILFVVGAEILKATLTTAALINQTWNVEGADCIVHRQGHCRNLTELCRALSTVSVDPNHAG